MNYTPFDEFINEFVLLDDRKQFVPLIKSKFYDYKAKKEGEYYKETIYIPCVFKNGKVLLVENGDLDNIFNKQTRELNVVECPKRFKEFEENLIVKKIESLTVKLDENGEPMYDEEGDAMYIETQETIYYHWNVAKFLEVK